MKAPGENVILEIEEQLENWASLDLEAAYLYWEDARTNAKSRRERRFAEKSSRQILYENCRLLAQQGFEDFLRTRGVQYQHGDKIAAKDFEQALWEYRLWGRIPLWLKTVISCSAVGIFYSVAIGSRHFSQYRYHPFSQWRHPIPAEASQILALVQTLPEAESLGIFGIVRKETDPILAAKVAGQWYKLYEWE